jgi:hypothetical protein
MRMGEIIPTGMQGKAIYGEGNYIIDGAAGTGKSTTVLQKIKLLEKHDRVPPEKVLVLVKNKSVIEEFHNLLKTIGITGLRMEVIEGFASSLFHETTWDIVALIDSTWTLACRVNEFLTKLKKEESLLSSRILSNVGNNYSSILKDFQHDSELTSLLNKYYKQREDFIALIKNNGQKINSKEKENKAELEKYKNQLTAKTIEKNNKDKRKSSIAKKSRNFERETNLTLDDEAKIRDALEKKEKELNSNIEKISNRLKKEEQKAFNTISTTNENIRLRILSDEFSKLHTSDYKESSLLKMQIKKLAGEAMPFHTIIVDEAQDVTLSNIHLAWLMTENIILTGDELQKESSDGIGSWNNLGKLENQFLTDGRLNVFTLSHNYRQTFELGNFSFNFRQLVLGKPVLDIREEYFENQKGFLKPQLAFINQESDFTAILNNKIRLINETFSDPLPVVIFYENDASLKRLADILDKEGIQYGYDGNENESVMFIDVNRISGRSFPVVMMPLISATSDNSIYIMISRAKYDLCIFTSESREINKHLENLLHQKIVVRYETIRRS